MERNNEIPKVCLPKVLRSFRDEISNECYLDITETPDKDKCYQLHFHISNISATYADDLFRLIYERLNVADKLELMHLQSI